VGRPVIDATLGELTATAIGHPLIPGDQRVDNDVTVGPAGTVLLITGSNMSGKSTLLRSIGLNLARARRRARVRGVVPHAAGPRPYEHSRRGLARAGPVVLHGGAARLKQIVDAAEKTRDPDRVLF
jgi:energy-coupling factor transporter ATP-binding protein EcfA2